EVTPAFDRSPPTTLQPAVAHASSTPRSMATTSTSPGAQIETTTAHGRPPIAATSLSAAIAVRYPRSATGNSDESRWMPSTPASQQNSTRPAGRASTAASSPQPVDEPARGTPSTSAIRSRATSSRQASPPRGAVVGFGGSTALAYHDPGAGSPGDCQGGRGEPTDREQATRGMGQRGRSAHD